MSTLANRCTASLERRVGSSSAATDGRGGQAARDHRFELRGGRRTNQKGQGKGNRHSLRALRMHLMVRNVCTVGDELLTKQKFMSRILARTPDSLIGKRMHKTPRGAGRSCDNTKPACWTSCRHRIRSNPDTKRACAARGAALRGSHDALLAVADEVEQQMAPGGDYDSVRPFAAKLPEHAARLGATMTASRDRNFTELQQRRFSARHADRRVLRELPGRGAASSELLPAQKLPPAKLLDRLQHEWTKDTVSARDIYTFGPRSIRDRQSATDLAVLDQNSGQVVALCRSRMERGPKV